MSLRPCYINFSRDKKFFRSKVDSTTGHFRAAIYLIELNHAWIVYQLKINDTLSRHFYRFLFQRNRRNRYIIFSIILNFNSLPPPTPRHLLFLSFFLFFFFFNSIRGSLTGCLFLTRHSRKNMQTYYWFWI